MFAVHANVLFGPALGAVYGVLFAIVFRNRALDPGSGLLWGLAYAFLLWLAVVPGAQVIAANLSSTFTTQRDNFPELVDIFSASDCRSAWCWGFLADGGVASRWRG